MDYKVENGSPSGKAFKTENDLIIVKSGETRVVENAVELSPEQLQYHADCNVTVTEHDAAKAAEEAAAAKAAEEAAAAKAAEEAAAAKAKTK